jgi:hypothetical protein
MLAIEIDIAAEKYLIINLYHSPNKNDAEFLKFLDDNLDEIVDFTGTIVFMGDFNLNLFHRIFVNHVLTKTRFRLNGVLKFVSLHRIF